MWKRSVHASLGRCCFQIPKQGLQQVRRREQQEYFSLSCGEPELDEGAPHADHGVPRDDADVWPLAPSETLKGDVDTLLRESPNRDLGSTGVISAHTQRREEIVGHASRSVRAFTQSPP